MRRSDQYSSVLTTELPLLSITKVFCSRKWKNTTTVARLWLTKDNLCSFTSPSPHLVEVQSDGFSISVNAYSVQVTFKSSDYLLRVRWPSQCWMNSLNTDPRMTRQTCRACTRTRTRDINIAKMVFVNIPLFSSRYNTKINTSFKKSHLKQRNCTKKTLIYTTV